MNEKTANTRTPAVPGVLDDPIRNRGVALSAAEREVLGLTGRLPSGVLTLEQQARRVYQQLQAQGDDLAKNVYLEQLHDRNEVLYYRVLADHLAELLPIVYDPTVGDAIEKYSHELATGLPIPPVDYRGVRYWIGQANNALLYPGLGLGTIVSGASKVTDGMHGGRLAGAVRPDEAGHLAGMDRERHLVQRLRRAEPLTQSVNLDSRVHGCP